MIDKFLEKFQEFNQNEIIADLTNEETIQLFGIYVSATLGANKPSGPTPAPKNIASAKTVRKPNLPATPKQIRFLKSLVKDGRVAEEPDYDELSRKEASDLISVGVSTPKKTAKPEPEPEPEGEFTGSFSHRSGGFESSGHFWDD